MLRKCFLLGDFLDRAPLSGRAGFYDYRRSYENITVLYTTPDRFEKQGIAIEMTSEGLDYFSGYLKSYGMTLKEWLSMWRAVAFGGLWVTKVTRFDYAMDDIRFKGETPCITLEKCFKAAERGEICKKARIVDIIDGAEISKRLRIKYCKGEPIKGRTLYVGVRKSGKIIRFYDKLAEQIQRKREVPEDCTPWTRCELELHQGDAMSAVNAFLDYSDDEFSEYMRGVVNNQCRFIVRNNTNVSRCPVKRWWSDFLSGCTKCFKLPRKAPVRSAYVRATRFLNQCTRTVYTLYQELGLEGVFRLFEDNVNKLKQNNKDPLIIELSENIRDGINECEEMTGIKNYTYHSTDEMLLYKNLKDQVKTYFSVYDKLSRSATIKEQHEFFMNYHGSLCDGL